LCTNQSVQIVIQFFEELPPWDNSSYVEDNKEFEEAWKKEELIKKEDRKMKASTPAEDKKPAKKKQSDEDKKPQGFEGFGTRTYSRSHRLQWGSHVPDKMERI